MTKPAKPQTIAEARLEEGTLTDLCLKLAYSINRFTYDYVVKRLHVAPNLAVEVVSPNDTVYDLDAKVALFLEAGTELVWVVNPEARTVKIHRPTGPGEKVFWERLGRKVRRMSTEVTDMFQ